MIKPVKILLVTLVAIGLFSCEKQPTTPTTPIEILTSKPWRFAKWSDDRNPSTNPVSYCIPPFLYSADCDDRFLFKSNGELQMFYGEKNCSWFGKELMDYEYNEEYQQLIIDGVTCPVLEISEQQIKFLIPVPSPPHQCGYLIVLLQ